MGEVRTMALNEAERGVLLKKLKKLSQWKKEEHI